MSLAILRAAIKAALEEVPSVGVVTDYEPYITSEPDLLTFFQVEANTQLLGWTITRERTDERDSTTSLDMDLHSMVIRGYAAVNSLGGSEKAFQDLIETARARLRQERVTGFGGRFNVYSPNVRTVEARTYAGVLVHYCEIVLPCDELVAVP